MPMPSRVKAKMERGNDLSFWLMKPGGGGGGGVGGERQGYVRYGGVWKAPMGPGVANHLPFWLMKPGGVFVPQADTHTVCALYVRDGACVRVHLHYGEDFGTLVYRLQAPWPYKQPTGQVLVYGGGHGVHGARGIEEIEVQERDQRNLGAVREGAGSGPRGQTCA